MTLVRGEIYIVICRKLLCGKKKHLEAHLAKRQEVLRYFGIVLNYQLSRYVSASWEPRKSEMLQVD